MSEFDPVVDFGFDPMEARGKERDHLTALSEHLDLINWLHTPESHREVSGLFISMAAEGTLRHPGGRAFTESELLNAGNFMVDDTLKALNKGMTLYIAPSMVTMMEAASNGLPEDATIDLADVPGPSGYVRFGRPIYLDWTTARGVTPQEKYSLTERDAPFAIRGLVWWLQDDPGKDPQLQMLWFAHRDDAQDPIAKAEWLASNQPDLAREWFGQADGGNVAIASDGDFEIRDRIVERLLNDRDELNARWENQERWLLDGHSGWTIGSPVMNVGSTARTMAAMFLLLQQRIGTVTGIAPDRRSRKNAERRGMTPDIRVVMLRRRVPRDPDNESGEQVEVKWTHRWLVNGFWRNQYYPSEGRHRRIWIMPYVKGPEDLPLVVKDVIYTMER